MSCHQRKEPRPRTFTDDRLYSVVGINGYRRAGFTREQAIAHARVLQKQMQDAGWAGKVQVFYRDGSAVAWEMTE